MGGAFWFLRVLFLVSVFYCICDYIIKLVFSKNLLLIQGLLSFGLLIFGYLCHLWGLYLHGLAQVASFYCLYFIGYLLSLWKDHYLHWKEKQFFILLASSFAFLLILNRLGTIALDQNSYCNPFYLLATSLTGWCFLFSLAYFITFSPFKKYLLQIGKQTLIIVILHFLSFKLVAALVVKIYNLPNYCMAAFPCLYGNRDLWWLAYTIVGVIVPLMLNFLYRSCTKKLKSMLLN